MTRIILILLVSPPLSFLLSSCGRIDFERLELETRNGSENDIYSDTSAATDTDRDTDVYLDTDAESDTENGTETNVVNPDECPNDPNKTEPGICGCGIPEMDSDGDGICDDSEEQWTNQSIPYSSGAGAAAVLSDGLHYLGGSFNFWADVIYRHHYVYDPVSQQWSNSPASVPDGDAWGARAHVYQDRLYLIGGYPKGSRFRVYDPNTNKWTSETPPPKTFEWGFASGIIGDSLYVFGGIPHSTSNAVGYKYSFSTKQWSGVAPIPHNQGRGALSSAVVGNKMYVLNGNSDDGTTILQIYNSGSNAWSFGPTLKGHFFEAAATAVLGSRVYFFGGADNHDISDSSSKPAILSNQVNIYDTAADNWYVGLPMTTPKMWATAEVFDGQIHVFGGLDAKSEQMDEHAIYTP